MEDGSSILIRKKMKNKKTIKYGIIGSGGIAHTHAQAILEIEEAKLIGVCGSSEQRSIDFADKYSIRNYKGIDEMLACPDIDAVTICTPSGYHAQMAIAAANAKKHAIIEKPLAIDTKSCDEIIKAFDENGVTGSVISQLRFSEDIQRAREMINSGRLGKICMSNLTMRYYRSQDYYDLSYWRGKWATDGGGALMNQGIHGVDILLFLNGKFKNVQGYIRTLQHDIEVEDNVVGIVDFENGAIATIIASTSSVPPQNKTLEVFGSKGSIVIEEDAIKSIYIEGEESFEASNINESDSVTSHLIGNEGHILQLKSFTQSLLLNKKPFVTLEDGKMAVELITSLYGSSDTNTIYKKVNKNRKKK